MKLVVKYNSLKYAENENKSQPEKKKQTILINLIIFFENRYLIFSINFSPAYLSRQKILGIKNSRYENPKKSRVYKNFCSSFDHKKSESILLKTIWKSNFID